MDSFKIKQGARLDLQVESQDTTSVSATLIIKPVDGNAVEFTEPFVDGIADFTNVDEISNLAVGVYEYQLNENYESGQPDKYPDPGNCDGDCTFPTIEICESLD